MSERPRARAGVLASGRGSNLSALLEASRQPGYPAEVVVVISDRPSAPALDVARAAGVPAVSVNREQYPTRAAHERAVIDTLKEHGVDIVCLAGYMRLVTGRMLEQFPDRVLNIHPSLLPSFPGREAQRQALEHGVKVTGCTVHLVDEGMDTGPIVLQAAVPVLPGDTVEALSARILEQEHELYPRALALLAAGRLSRRGQVVEIGGDL